MSHPPEPRPLFQCAVDVRLAESGDKAAKSRVWRQNSRIRKREKEIQEWRMLYGTDVSSFDNNDNTCDNDDAYVNDDNNDDDDEQRYV